MRPNSNRALLTVLPLLLLAGLLAPAAAGPLDHERRRGSNKIAETPSAAVDSKVEIVHVQRGIYMLYAGAGSNVTVQVGEQGVLVVDAAVASVSDKILAAIRSLSDKPIRYLFDTNADIDHVGGNPKISAAGILYGGGYTHDQQHSFIWAHENVLNAVSAPTGQTGLLPSASWPTASYFVGKMELNFNDEAIEMLHMANAHSDGDSIVFFRGSDVIVAGDVYITTGYPVIELERGGSIDGIIAALNRIIDITIPLRNQEDGTLVVPGHGRVSDEYDVVVYRDMLTIIRDRIVALMGKGMSLDAIKAARPSSDYDARYGATEGTWTTDKFIEAICKSLPAQPPLAK
jgi:cyclase